MRKIIIFLLFISSVSFADETECRSVLSKCDSALRAQQEVNSLQQQIIADQDARYKEQTTELKTQQLWKPIAEISIGAVIVETLLLVLKK